ncbi:hydroxymethylglutaryl-CoA reductase [Aspergillus flavus]|uniref:hydroxymethylglutaryl-CoA reductase (NADPH) n=1 Tax=Aspergillus flavus TaxID=5059 RepID=A0A5N6GMT8_ASPFL|nr:hydroxymethylglutaryl-CoA reductase [Aspergillus flavus]
MPDMSCTFESLLYHTPAPLTSLGRVFPYMPPAYYFVLLRYFMNMTRIPQAITSKFQTSRASDGETSSVKIENCVGFTRVPLGVAGPLQVQGSDGTTGSFYGPLATCEATLIASCSRGCKALNTCQGVRFKILHDSMSRAPAFWFASTEDAVAFFDLVPSLQPKFKKDAESTSKHVRLRTVIPHIVGSSVHVRFEYLCGDAAGQNIVTIATQRVCDRFSASAEAHALRLQRITTDNQMSSDKKLAWGNIIRTRGVRVLVWGSVSNDVSKRVLGCSTELLYQSILNSKEGAAMNGQLGYSVNPSNVIAAMFIACGQDAASVAEAAWSQLTAEYDADTKLLRLISYFPSLPVGVVGGGTAYPTQRESLEILGCNVPGTKHRLAGLIASFSLALDISTLAALATQTFSRSHEKLVRGRWSPETKL